MSLDDTEKDDLGVENPLGVGLDKDKEEEKEKNPSDALTVAGALAAIAGREKFADVYFLVGEGKDQRRIPAHRVVLAASSDIFEAMLYPTDFPDDKVADKKGEKDDKSALLSTDDKEKEIEISDVKPAIFRTLLAAVYGDTADIKADELPELIIAAKKFQLEGLRLLCVQFMEEGVTVDSACKLFENAHKMLNEKNFGLSFIEENATEIVASPSFDTLSKGRLMDILKSNRLSIDEIDLFKGVLRWATTECKRQNLKDTVESKKKVLEDIIPIIRFPLMAMEDVATFVSPSGMLESNQLLEIFTYLGQPESKKPRVSFPSTARAGAVDKWSLDNNMKSSYVTLSNKNMTARNTNSQHSYCNGTHEFKKGVHCWRVTRDQGPTQWFGVGVCRKQALNDSAPFNDASFYGLSGSNQKYFAGQNQTSTTNFATGPIDVQLDCDQGTLVVINLSTSQRADVTGIPRNTPLVPSFCPHSNQQISIKPIKVREFGRRT